MIGPTLPPAPLLGSARAPLLHVMTLNVRRDVGVLAWRRADRWAQRRPRLEALLRADRPHVLGTQEVLPAQAALIRRALGDGYRVVGHGHRPGPRGEGCPIFYDATRLTLLHARQFAVSTDPGRVGSTSWGGVIPRVAVLATFRDRPTATRFVVINTHLEAFSRRARRRGAELLHRVAARQPWATVLLGDLNAGPGSPPWDALCADGVLTDAWTAAERRASPAWGTLAGYRRPVPGRRIDAILVSPGLPVVSIAIDGRRFAGGWASDHLPVRAVLRLDPADPEETP